MSNGKTIGKWCRMKRLWSNLKYYVERGWEKTRHFSKHRFGRDSKHAIQNTKQKICPFFEHIWLNSFHHWTKTNKQFKDKLPWEVTGNCEVLFPLYIRFADVICIHMEPFLMTSLICNLVTGPKQWLYYCVCTRNAEIHLLTSNY